ncbi:GD17235 [Drosophila simulans]|uniref:GD17235 n=1 Tax=Drosophila simulans TaxID=7240 RepID=B4R5H2_DROSI|nr:GD17235 [Drosophila simulans]
MASISLLNPKAEFARASQALAINISAAKGLQDVMRSNLGPKGTVKIWFLAPATSRSPRMAMSCCTKCRSSIRLPL